MRQGRGRQGDTWHLDELFVKIQGRQQYLWRAVDEDGDVLDILVQSRRNRWAATRFFRKLLNKQGCEPRRLILPPPAPGRPYDPISSRQRLGGMLKVDYRPAA
ncbi:MAG: DDE-type integrase/transposase/recombinase [Acidobacteria bacterium]|nr:DDE-type integrase/transposase/recombinase [Acidobacteriota bacterium]